MSDVKGLCDPIFQAELNFNPDQLHKTVYQSEEGRNEWNISICWGTGQLLMFLGLSTHLTSASMRFFPYFQGGSLVASSFWKDDLKDGLWEVTIALFRVPLVLLCLNGTIQPINLVDVKVLFVQSINQKQRKKSFCAKYYNGEAIIMNLSYIGCQPKIRVLPL